MRKLLLYSLVTAVALVGSYARADTLHLKNGSVIKGKVTSFADDQFVVMIETGSGRYLSKAQIYIGDVARIEFDSSAAMAPADTTPIREAVAPPKTQPESPRESSSTAGEPPVKTSGDATARTVSPAGKPPAPDPEPTPPEKTPPAAAPTTAPPATDTSESKAADQMAATNIDVAAKRDWTSTGIIVKRGDKIRITGAGTITLDAVNARTSGPEGIDLPDSRKLMGDRPTGALIAVIGADNDDFLFVGKQAEFTAAREGLLFLSVNEGALSDNSGAYKATIEVQTKRAPLR